MEQTDFFNVNAWRSVAVNVAESLTTGARVLVTGRLQARTWETEDGQKRSAVEIEAEEVAASLRFATVAITKAASCRRGPGPGRGGAGVGPPAASWGVFGVRAPGAPLLHAAAGEAGASRCDPLSRVARHCFP